MYLSKNDEKLLSEIMVKLLDTAVIVPSDHSLIDYAHSLNKLIIKHSQSRDQYNKRMWEYIKMRRLTDKNYGRPKK